MKRKAGQTRRAPDTDAYTAEPARREPPARATVAVYADRGDIPALCGSEGAAESEDPIQRRAVQLAARLGLPFLPAGESADNMVRQPAYDMLLTVTPERLELRLPDRGGPRPLYVDFVGGPLGYARRVNRFGLLFQAVGFRRGRPTVLDATGGLGRDAFRLAYRGCRVTAIERSPVLFALLQDGLERAARVPEIHEELGDRLRVLHADARDVLRQIASGMLQQRESGVRREGEAPTEPPLVGRRPVPSQPVISGDARECDLSDPAGVPSTPDVPDVVYLDPMFAPQRKSALVKVEMRILRQLVGDDLDAGELFELACAVARQRVVVKRHRHAAPLAPNPTHSYVDKTTRYDVYVRPLQVTRAGSPG